MSDGITEGEFTRTLQILRDDMSRGFAALRDDSRAGFLGVNARLDILNGQTRKHGESIAVLEERAESLKAADEAQDVAIDALSSSYNGLSLLIKTKTREAVKEVAPSKRLILTASGIGAALAEAAWRVWSMRGGG